MADDVIGNYIDSDGSCAAIGLDLFKNPDVSYYYDSVDYQVLYPVIPLTPETRSFEFVISPDPNFISLQNIMLETTLKVELEDGKQLPKPHKPAPPPPVSNDDKQSKASVNSSCFMSCPSKGSKRGRDSEREQRLKARKSKDRARSNDDDDDNNDDSNNDNDDDDDNDDNDNNNEGMRYRRKMRRKLRKKLRAEQNRDVERKDDESRATFYWLQKLVEEKRKKRKEEKRKKRKEISQRYPSPWNELSWKKAPPNPEPEEFLGVGLDQSPHYLIYKDVEVILNNETLSPMNGLYGLQAAIYSAIWFSSDTRRSKMEAEGYYDDVSIIVVFFVICYYYLII